MKFYYLKHAAESMLTLAIRHGDVIPASRCEYCGNTSQRQLDGHHFDYSKPLEVIWLCRSCHKKNHFDNNEHGKRATVKLQLAIDWLNQNPHKVDLPSRVLADLIGVSHTLANEAKRRILSTNGHSNGNGAHS